MLDNAINCRKSRSSTVLIYSHAFWPSSASSIFVLGHPSPFSVSSYIFRYGTWSEATFISQFPITIKTLASLLVMSTGSFSHLPSTQKQLLYPIEEHFQIKVPAPVVQTNSINIRNLLPPSKHMLLHLSKEDAGLLFN